MTRGMTLVELVLTIGLAGLVGIPAAMVMSEHLAAALRARDSALALQLARQELERIDGLNNFFAPDLAVGTATLTNYQGFRYTVTRTVSCLIGNCTSTAVTSQGVKQIQVVVRRSDASTPLARGVTYRTKHVAFGT